MRIIINLNPSNTYMTNQVDHRQETSSLMFLAFPPLNLLSLIETNGPCIKNTQYNRDLKDWSYQRIHCIWSEPVSIKHDQLSRLQRPQLLGIPEQGGISAEEPSEVDAANTDSFFSSLTDPQDGHFACPFHSLERTRISESLLQSSQLNS